tara:strand:- start:285 stop:398 length:114 start_codon:yes stop_codon:yes gene_type:complete
MPLATAEAPELLTVAEKIGEKGEVEGSGKKVGVRTFR